MSKIIHCFISFLTLLKSLFLYTKDLMKTKTEILKFNKEVLSNIFCTFSGSQYVLSVSWFLFSSWLSGRFVCQLPRSWHQSRLKNGLYEIKLALIQVQIPEMITSFTLYCLVNTTKLSWDIMVFISYMYVLRFTLKNHGE